MCFFFQHERYSPFFLLNDIALIHLATPADVSDEFISTVALAPSDSGDFVGDECYIIGWGTIEVNPDGKSGNTTISACFECGYRWVQLNPVQNWSVSQVFLKPLLNPCCVILHTYIIKNGRRIFTQFYLFGLSRTHLYFRVFSFWKLRTIRGNCTNSS